MARESIKHKLGIWGVRNYHSTLEKRALAGAQMSGGYIAMAVAATVMATAGLLLNSVAAIIGSMCVAPFMGPSRAVCIGMIYRNWPVFFGGLVKQLIGLLLIGVSVAALVTWLLNNNLPGIAITPEILIRAMPTERDAVLSTLIAVSAGAAASLALVAQPQVVESPWGQVIDAIIGVEIAVSLVPPAAVIGIGLALNAPEHSKNAFYLLMLNVVCLNLIGSASILLIRGMRLRHLQQEQRIRKAVEDTIEEVPGFIAVGSSIDITLFDENSANIDIILRRRFGGKVPENLATRIAQDVETQTGCKGDIVIEVVPLLTHLN